LICCSAQSSSRDSAETKTQTPLESLPAGRQGAVGVSPHHSRHYAELAEPVNGFLSSQQRYLKIVLIFGVFFICA